MRKPTVLLLLLLAPLSLAFGQADSQWYLGKPIKSITFTGLNHVQLSDLTGITKDYIGKNFSDTIFWDLQSKLYALDYFQQFTPTALPGDASKSTVIINFNVIERPTVSAVVILGNGHVTKSDVNGVIVLKKDDIVNNTKIRTDVDAIKNLYLERGFPQVRVTSDVQLDRKTNTAVVLYTIKEGAQTKVKRVLFVGNRFAAESTLRGLLKTKEQSLFSSAVFQESNLADDKTAIIKYYQDHGFEDVKVTAITRQQEIDPSNGQVDLILTYHIEEGTQYTYGGTTFQGNTLFSTAMLTSMIDQKLDAVVDKTKLDADFGKINDLYLNDGYIFNTINRHETKDPRTGVISYQVTIIERERAHIENIIIKGNTKTKDFVIRRELPIEVGDVFSKDKIIEGLRNLYNTQFFSSVTPETPPGSVDGLMDLVLNVEEAKTTDINVGASLSGAQAGFPLLLFLKYTDHDFLGLGNEFDVGIQGSETEQDLTFSYNQKWLFDQRWSNGVNLTLDHTLVTDEPEDDLPPIFTGQTNAVPNPYNGHYVFANTTTYNGTTYQPGQPFPGVPNETQIAEYDLETDYAYAISHNTTIPVGYLMQYDSYTIALGFNTAYSWYLPVGRLTLGAGLSYGVTLAVYDSDLYRPFDPIVRDNLDNWETIPKFSLTASFDTRDLVYSPSSGYYVKQTATYVGGILPSFAFAATGREYIATNSSFEIYQTLFSFPLTDSFNLKAVADVRTYLSYIFPQFGEATPIATSQDLLYIDGITSGLGWDRREDGESLWDTFLELRFPIVEKYFWWDFYFEGTDMEPVPSIEDPFLMNGLSDYLFSTGGGIRLTVPGLPIAVYLAKRFQVENGQIQWQQGAIPGINMDFVFSFFSSY